jgi:hypothetical protein
VTDPVVPQDLFEQHLMSARLGEAAGELHPVIGQNLGGQQVRKPSTSAAQTPPMMSICHSDIGASRSQGR